MIIELLCFIYIPVIYNNYLLLLQIIEKLVDVVCHIRQTIVEVFGNNGNGSLRFWSCDYDRTCIKSWIKDTINQQ